MRIRSSLAAAVWLLLFGWDLSVNGLVVPRHVVFARRWSHIAAGAIPAAFHTDDGLDRHHALDNFTSQPTSLYIEDTDAYGVKYNANYLRSYERALHQAFFSHAGDESKADWSIVSVDSIKLQQAPKLGDENVIHGTLVSDPKSKSTQQTWDLTMTSPDGAIVYSTAHGVTIHSMVDETAPLLPIPVEFSFDSTTSTTPSQHVDTFNTYRDEFDAHLPHHLPLYSVLKLFERARSNWIGGPFALKRLQDDDKVLYVVTKFSELELLEDERDQRQRQPLTPGNCPVTIQTEFVARRGGMVVDCFQTALIRVNKGDDYSPNDEYSIKIAQGKVTIMALNSKTWRPTKKLPEWFMSKF